MLVDVIIGIVTALLGGFVTIWALYSQLRPWLEAPKYRVLEWEERFSETEQKPKE